MWKRLCNWWTRRLANPGSPLRQNRSPHADHEAGHYRKLTGRRISSKQTARQGRIRARVRRVAHLPVSSARQFNQWCQSGDSFCRDACHDICDTRHVGGAAKVQGLQVLSSVSILLRILFARLASVLRTQQIALAQPGAFCRESVEGWRVLWRRVVSEE